MSEEEIIEYVINSLIAGGDLSSLGSYYKSIKYDSIQDPSIMLKYIDYLASNDVDAKFFNNYFNDIGENCSNVRILRRSYEIFLKKEEYEKAYSFLEKIIDLEPENFNLYIDMIELCRHKMNDDKAAFMWYKRANNNCHEPVSPSRSELENWKSIALYFKKRNPSYNPVLFEELLQDKLIFNKNGLKVDLNKETFILIDGSNLIYENERGQKKEAKVENLWTIVEHFEKIRKENPNLDYIIFADASLAHNINNRKVYNQLLDSGYVNQIPAGTAADYFIIDFFKRQPDKTLVISNDQFRDILANETKEIRNKFNSRRFPMMIIFREVIIPRFPIQPKSSTDVKIQDKNIDNVILKKLEPDTRLKEESEHSEIETQTDTEQIIQKNLQNEFIVIENADEIEARGRIEEIEERNLEAKDLKWLNIIALVYKRIILFGEHPNFGNLAQKIKDEYGDWNHDYPTPLKFRELMERLAQKYKLKITENPKNNFILEIKPKVLKTLIDPKDTRLNKYYYEMLDEYISNQADLILGDEFTDKEQSYFLFFLTVCQIINNNKKPVCESSIQEIINRYNEDMRELKHENISEVLSNDKFKAVLKQTKIGKVDYLSVILFGFEYFADYIPKEVIEPEYEPDEDETTQDSIEDLQPEQNGADIAPTISLDEVQQEIITQLDLNQQPNTETVADIIQNETSGQPDQAGTTSTLIDQPQDQITELSIVQTETTETEQPVKKDKIVPKRVKPEILKEYSDEELKWFGRILNIAKIIMKKKVTATKEVHLTDIATGIVKLYGVNSWKKELPEYDELVTMMEAFSQKFDFVMRMTKKQDYVILFNAQIIEIGRNIISYLLQKNKNITEWDASLLNFKFSIEEMAVINILTREMDSMIREGKLPTLKEIMPRMQEKLSKQKNQTIRTINLELILQKLIDHGVIGVSTISQNRIIQLKKRMSEVGTFEDNIITP